ncbi:uncharacterized protein [Littorina saxatilis]|uniref:uncharacterized protein n=1 Tax=Littorina saxatilis TaxID=31220 RepID=UPI0038B66717
MEEKGGYPPECSSTQNNVSFPDSAAVGTCSTVTVQCSTNGPDTTLNVTNSTDGPVRWTISHGNMDTDSSLVFTVCVTDVLFHFIGQYEASLNVSNSTGVTSVTWSVTIDDVNQPPAFLSASYNIQVSENTAVQATIAQVPLVTSRAMADSTSNNVITVWDPDNVTAGFEFKGINVQSVNVTYPNSSKATTTDQSNLPVYLRNDSGPPFSFLTRSPLSAGVHLAFTLQAEDEQGLVGSNTVVTFVVSDVNQAPVCDSGNFNLTVGLIRKVNDSIYNVSCTDNDVNSTLSSLTYHEYTTSDSDYQYFSISSRGEISLEQRLPLNVTTLTYTVYVIDGGDLEANFTLFVDIDRQ